MRLREIPDGQRQMRIQRFSLFMPLRSDPSQTGEPYSYTVLERGQP